MNGTLTGKSIPVLSLLLWAILASTGCSGSSKSASVASPTPADLVRTVAEATPTAVPALSDFKTPVPSPAPTALPAATPVPALPPDRASCAEIKGTLYRSETEHQWYVANCLATATAPGPAAAAQPAPPPPPPAAAAPPRAGTAVPTQDEQRYRNQATAQLVYGFVRLKQAINAGIGPGGADQFALQGGSIIDGLISTLDGLAPVPARFRGVHDELRASLVPVRESFRAAPKIKSLKDLDLWYADASPKIDRADDAISSYALVVGIQAPSIK